MMRVRVDMYEPVGFLLTCYRPRPGRLIFEIVGLAFRWQIRRCFRQGFFKKPRRITLIAPRKGLRATMPPVFPETRKTKFAEAGLSLDFHVSAQVIRRTAYPAIATLLTHGRQLTTGFAKFFVHRFFASLRGGIETGNVHSFCL